MQGEVFNRTFLVAEITLSRGTAEIKEEDFAVYQHIIANDDASSPLNPRGEDIGVKAFAVAVAVGLEQGLRDKDAADEINDPAEELVEEAEQAKDRLHARQAESQGQRMDCPRSTRRGMVREANCPSEFHAHFIYTAAIVVAPSELLCRVDTAVLFQFTRVPNF